MNRKQLRQYQPGTPEYVVLHAAWSSSRGRNPSATLSTKQACEVNPREALKWATRYAYFPKESTYLGGTTPTNYVCGNCGVAGVKLWREYQTFMEHQSLRCMNCACKEQGKVRTPTEDGYALYTEEEHYYRTTNMQYGCWKSYDPKDGTPSDAIETRTEREKTDQIGWRIPAVPTEKNDSYWGYTSVPQPGCDWWKMLPTLAMTDDKMAT